MSVTCVFECAAAAAQLFFEDFRATFLSACLPRLAAPGMLSNLIFQFPKLHFLWKKKKMKILLALNLFKSLCSHSPDVYLSFVSSLPVRRREGKNRGEG